MNTSKTYTNSNILAVILGISIGLAILIHTQAYRIDKHFEEQNRQVKEQKAILTELKQSFEEHFTYQSEQTAIGLKIFRDFKDVSNQLEKIEKGYK